MRRDLTQDALAALMPLERGKSRSDRWIAGVEKGEIKSLRPRDTEALAIHLHISVSYLVMGKTAEESEFIASIRGLERFLGPPQRRQLLALLQSMATEHPDWQHPGIEQPRAAEAPAEYSAERPQQTRRARGG